MKLEQQVVSLELAKKLKELGVLQNSYFKWTDWYNGVLNYGKPSENFRAEWHLVTTPVWLDETVVSAFTVAELGEMLPDSCEFYKTNPKTVASKKGTWAVCVYPEDKKQHKEYAETLADAIAKMLIYLIENGLMKI